MQPFLFFKPLQPRVLLHSAIIPISSVMKKLFLILLLISAAFSANAQIGYLPTYSNPGRSVSVGSGYENYGIYDDDYTSTTTTVRATAYAVNEQGYVLKMPIRVRVTSSYGGESLKVVQYYDNSGYGGGKWVGVGSYQGSVTRCSRSSYGRWGSNSDLESNFMYKTQLGGSLLFWYFDL